MFCTQCGRELPKDGNPCVCGSGQAELVVQNRTDEQEWAMDETAVPVEQEEPAASIELEIPAWEETAPLAETAEPQPEETEQAAPVWAETQPQPEQPQAYIPPVYPQPYAQPAYAVQQENPVLQVIRSIAGSPLFLIAAIVMSLHFVISIVNRLMPIDFSGIVYTIVGSLDSMMPGLGAELMRELEPMLAELYAAQASFSFIGMLGMITPALVLAALWMIFGSAKRPDGPSTAGLTILQVLQILSVIGLSFCILLAAIVAAVLIAVSQMIIDEMGAYGMVVTTDMNAGITAGIILVAVGLMLGVIFALIYAAKVLSTVVGVKKAIRTGVVVKKASGFVAVINLISAASLVLDIYGTFVLFGWTAALLNLLTAAANVLFAVCIFKYNKAMKPLRVPKNAVGYIPQQ